MKKVFGLFEIKRFILEADIEIKYCQNKNKLIGGKRICPII